MQAKEWIFRIVYNHFLLLSLFSHMWKVERNHTMDIYKAINNNGLILYA